MRWLTTALAATVLGGAAGAADSGRGERLYREGLGAEALLAGGTVRVPAKSFSCAGCHGADGLGRREGGTIFPSLVWSDLADPGRGPAAYSPAGIEQTLATGVTPDGRRLGAAMPRFLLEPGVAEGLVDFLGALEGLETAGLTATEVRLAPFADRDSTAGFRAALEAENEAGGAWGRRFVVSPAGPTLVTGSEAATALAPALDRALAQSAAHALSASGVRAVAAQPEWAPALSDAGISVQAGALARLQRSDVGLVLTLPDARVLTLAVWPDGYALAAAGGRASAAAHGFLTGSKTAEAALACGRAATRTCLLESLAALNLSDLVVTLP